MELVKNCDLRAIVLEIVILDHFPRMGGGVGADTGRNLKLNRNFRWNKSHVLLEKEESTTL